MIVPATVAAQRPPDACLLAADRQGRFRHLLRKNLVDLLDSGDLVIANDAATLPASLHGTLDRTGEPIEVRLAGWPSPATTEVSLFSAIVFGAGDFRLRTEDRPAPRDLSARR